MFRYTLDEETLALCDPYRWAAKYRSSQFGRGGRCRIPEIADTLPTRPYCTPVCLLRTLRRGLASRVSWIHRALEVFSFLLKAIHSLSLSSFSQGPFLISNLSILYVCFDDIESGREEASLGGWFGRFGCGIFALLSRWEQQHSIAENASTTWHPRHSKSSWLRLEIFPVEWTSLTSFHRITSIPFLSLQTRSLHLTVVF